MEGASLNEIRTEILKIQELLKTEYLDLCFKSKRPASEFEDLDLILFTFLGTKMGEEVYKEIGHNYERVRLTKLND